MSATARALVLCEPERLEFHEFERPRIGRDDGILRVDLAAICGTDWKYFHGKLAAPYPFILGHEILGTIDEVGPDAARRWGVQPGDVVVVEPTVPCWSCRACYTGNTRFCANKQGYGGKTASDRPPYFWGGFAELMYLLPTAVVHKVARGVSAEAAVLSTGVVANGIQWTRNMGRVRYQDAVVVQGAGPQGVACAVVARECGASVVALTGLERDAGRLAIARELGIQHTVDVSTQDPVAVVRDLTGGEMANVVIDVTGSSAAWPSSVGMLRRQGRLVLGGLTGRGTQTPVQLDDLVWNEIQVQGAFTKSPDAVQDSLRLIESGRYQWEKLVTHAFPLAEAEHAIRAIGGEVEGLYPMKAVLRV
jgi:alcohol dehydrogenase